MSPIADPRFAAGRQEMMVRERADSDLQARLEYIKPLVIVAIGWVIVFAVIGTSGDGEASGAMRIALYLITTAIGLACGVAGLWLACKLWLGGVDSLGLAILRLAAIYAITDALGMFTSGLMILGWFINCVVYVALLMWLFELEPGESIMLALITFVIKVAVGIVLMLALTT